MSRHGGRKLQVVCCFPRVSGDEPPVILFFLWVAMFSPRERG